MAQSDASNRWLELLKTEKYSDMAIICQGVEFKVHRAAVCPQSPMLDAAFGGQLQVIEHARSVGLLVANHCEQEAQTGRINFPEEIPSIMSRIIYYLYTGECDFSTVPEIFQRLCADPDDLKLNGSEEGEAMDQDSVSDRFNTQEVDVKSMQTAKVAAMVYKSAGMMMIDHLKSSAAEHFVTYTRDNFHDHDFHSALRTMCKNTSENDEVLRLPVMKFMLRKRNDPWGERIPHEQTIEVLREYSAGFWDMATNELNKIEKQMKAELKKAEQKRKEEVRKMEMEWKEKLDRNTRGYENSLRDQAELIAADLNRDDIRCKYRRKLGFETREGRVIPPITGINQDYGQRKWVLRASTSELKCRCGTDYGDGWW